MFGASSIKLITFHYSCKPFLILYGLLRASLILISYSLPTIAQPAVYNGLPLPPPSNQPLPPVPISPQEYNTYQQNGIPPGYINHPGSSNYPTAPTVQYWQDNQGFERYLVYIEDSNFQTLQQVRLLEPTAYIRNFQGRSVIQAGIFSKASNAQQRVQELANYGIYQARIVNFSNNQEIPYHPNHANNQSLVASSPAQSNHKYYVAIPASTTQATAIANQIRSNIGEKANISIRNNSRGSYVAVGPFAERSQAQEWNSYMKKLGFSNARVYYAR